jgi:hypothetical protein
MGVPPDEDIALEGLERVGRCKALSQTVWDFHLEVGEAAEAGERDSLLEGCGLPVQISAIWGEKYSSGPDYVVDSLPRLVSGVR